MSNQDFIDVFLKHQEDCETQGKYVEAEMARCRIKELKDQQRKCEEQALKAQ